MVDPLGLGRPDPRLSWTLAGEAGRRQTAYQVQAGAWDSGRVEGDATAVRYAGPPLGSRARVPWRVRVWDDDGRSSTWSDLALFELGLLRPEDWVAEWVTLTRPAAGEHRHTGAIHFRTSFELPAGRRAVAARLYASALGLSHLWCNGRPVSDDVFRPGWTDYHKRVQHQTYDVTHLVRPGANVVAALVGDGWYAGDIGMGKRQVWGQWPEHIAQMEVDLDDGSRLVVPTSAAATRASLGPVVANDLQQGEAYDARLEHDGWTEPGFVDAEWTGPFLPFPGGGPVGRLVPQVGPPVRAILERRPTLRTSPAPGVWVFDFGQNLVGWCRLRVRGPAGTTVTLRHAEMLQPDGSLYTENLRGAANTDRYTLAGRDETEEWEPRFTFHGFRYVELTGYPGEPDLDALTAVVAHSDMAPSGYFECSNALVNQLVSNIEWGQRGNFVDVPTDCPQRDERLGWMGDAQIFVGTASYNMDVAPFFTKWLADVRDAQLDLGAFPDVVPRFGRANPTAAPGWGDAGIAVPWSLYRRYGDVRVLEDHYDSMVRWIEYLHRRNPSLRWRAARGCDWGDHVAIDTGNPKDVIATAWWAQSTATLASIASLLDRPDDAARFADLALGIRAAWRDDHLGPDGFVDGDTQTVYALAIRFGLVDPGEEREAAGRRLVADIEARGGHLSTGFLGIAHLLPALTDIGRADVAYRLLENDTFPSWGYSIRHGATTIWERWDGWTEHAGFQNPGMNSFNHYAFGAVGEWLYETVAGIRVDFTAAPVITIAPQPGGTLTSASASYRSVLGTITSSWRRASRGRFELDVCVPAGQSAAVVLPSGERHHAGGGTHQWQGPWPIFAGPTGQRPTP